MIDLPIRRTEIPGPRSHALAKALRGSESPNITYLAPDFPVFWESAHGCWVTDVDGNTYLDLTAAFGVASVGHSHPAVVAAIQTQSSRLIHGMGDVHPSAAKVALCERICAAVPLPQPRVILSQNGSDAIESALKTAALATGKPGVIAFTGGYHGLSYGALDTTARADFRDPFFGQLGHFTQHYPYGCDPSLVMEALAASPIGAILVEPIQGRGGIVVPPTGWLAALRDCCAQTQTVLIFDEIFTGWGRTGTLFACEYENVIPDILCIGKAMGGGLPISACVASESVMAAWGESQGESLHTSTFLGNPLACAAALAAIDIIVSDDLSSRARMTGQFFIGELQRLQSQFSDMIVSVRGRGLMLGLEFASPALALSLVPKALQVGLIVLPAGDGRILEFVPPLIITENEIALCVSLLEQIIQASRIPV